MWMDQFIRACNRHTPVKAGCAHLAVLVLLSVAALGACEETACHTGGPCTEDNLRLYIEAPGGTMPPGSYMIIIDTDVGKMECGITVDPNVTGGYSGTCDHDLATKAPCVLANDTQQQENSCRSVNVHVYLEYSPARFDVWYRGILSHLSVHVERDGAVLLDKSMSPDYLTFGSEECNNECRQADITVKLP